MWKVKINHPEKYPHQVTLSGYLKFFETNEPYLYSRGDALKKANWFGGKIEKEEVVPTEESSLIILSANDLLYEVRELIKYRDEFAGKQGDTHLIKSDIFITIREELEQMAQEDKHFKPKQTIISQLVQLSQICTSEYVLFKDMCFS